MKKFVFVLTTLMALCFAMPTQNCHAKENSYFAKVQSTGVYLLNTPNQEDTLFEIPYSYFVKVQSVEGNFFKVSYKDVEGFVAKSQVSLMECDPLSPYAAATFKLFVPYNLYSLPSKTSSKVLQLQEDATLTYYGTQTGQHVTSNNNIWYYCSILQNGKTEYGYVFSEVTDLLTKFPTNNETYTIVNESVLSPQDVPTFGGLSTGTKVLLIVAIAVPSVLILYFLIKPSKIVQITKSRRKNKKSPKKVQHGDYFEFDESQL